MEVYVDLEKNGFSLEEFEDIKRCLETLLSIRAGTQPLDRELGIDLDPIVDYPLNVAKNMLALEIIEKVERYEPRVEVRSIDFKTNTDGQIKPYIHFVKREG